MAYAATIGTEAPGARRSDIGEIALAALGNASITNRLPAEIGMANEVDAAQDREGSDYWSETDMFGMNIFRRRFLNAAARRSPKACLSHT